MKWLAVLAILALGNAAANDWFGVEFIGWGTLYDSTDNSFGSGLPAEIGSHTVTFVGSDEASNYLYFMLQGDYTSNGWPELLVWSDTRFGEWDRDRLSAITPLTGAYGPGGATVTYWGG